MARDWSQRKRRDPYWRAAKGEGFRSRSAYKLLQLNDRFRFIGRGNVVVDLGAAPGGWSQVARMKVGPQGRVIAVDIAPMPAIPGVEIIRGDITSEETVAILNEKLPDGADLLISDMAPNISGNYSYDHARSAHLVEAAARVSALVLKPNGRLVAKLFSGDLMDELRVKLQRDFEHLKVTKPPASRAQSAEVYLLAAGFRGRKESPPAPAAAEGADGAGG
jgi:23S rRNA (uridine2552-2'-O)-methyltransferase